MAESDKPPDSTKEPNLTPNQQAIEDLSWDIPFARPVWNFFVREGKAVKNGWVAVLIIAAIVFWFTHSWTQDGVDAKISGLENSFKSQISEIKGQLDDAKQDRDKYQLLLAPFQAMAIAKYTNAPLEQRLELYSQTLSAVTNELESDRPIIHLEINGQKFTSYVSPKLGTAIQLTPLILNTNRQIALQIYNDSETTAEHATVDFMADTDPTNIVADQWTLEPKSSGGMNHWRSVSDESIGSIGNWDFQTITISQNYNQPSLVAQIFIHADRSKTSEYAIGFIIQ